MMCFVGYSPFVNLYIPSKVRNLDGYFQEKHSLLLVVVASMACIITVHRFNKKKTN